MPNLTDLARDERSARRLLSFVATPNDEATGRLLGRLGAEDVVAQVDSDRSIPGMGRAEAAVWRDRIHARYRVGREMGRVRDRVDRFKAGTRGRLPHRNHSDLDTNRC